MIAVGATAEVAKVFIIPGRYCTALGTRFKPSPTDNETAIITIFRLFMVTSVSIFMPAEATIPNMTITPPPSTGKGIEAIIAPIFGIRPHTTIIKPAIVTTWRDIIPVIPTMPTFWLKEVFGKPPKTPATEVPKPSA